ncbi:Multiple organellar RNA editing factor 1, mitochondrial [Vitis vinifera]|uniref:Multiple organellar RNA editing factor 1, mitochondrial n=1 Tax=Vitis vinifera TaxID=29760 RepID=A0A438GUX6_VITVI|nr:Multiple organellar RNA editing factor 1, mitochondrial [Vitis vinifera]
MLRSVVEVYGLKCVVGVHGLRFDFCHRLNDLDYLCGRGKLKMYACSTTTYTGFQAVMTEEESEKFRGLPGVVFILQILILILQQRRDKYINGTIIPRPPQFSMGGQVEDMVTEIEILRGQDMTARWSNAKSTRESHMITVDLCKETEGTMGLHKIIHHNRIMGQQDKVHANEQQGLCHGGRDTYQGERRDTMLHIRAITTKVSKEIIIPRNEETSHKEHRGIMLLLIRGMLEEIIGIIILNTVVIMARNRWIYGQGMGSGPSGYGQAHQGHGEGQRFSQVDQRNDVQEEQRNYHLREIRTK